MDQKMDRKWIYRLGAVFFILFAIIGLRMFYLGIIKGDELAAKASRQYTGGIDYYQYGRGDFLDTHGRKITNNPSACLVLFPAALGDEATVAQSLAPLIDYSADSIEKRIAAAVNNGQSAFILKSNLTEAEIGSVSGLQEAGVHVLSLAARYSATAPAIHILGFLEEEEGGGYHGVSGLELRYDDYLQGRAGYTVAALFDERGRQLDGNGFVVIPSDQVDTACDVRLTLDLDFQEKLEQALAPYEGAAVVLDVANGDILAMASSPDINPYLQTEIPSDDAYVNKTLGFYPPASTFKILLAAAALEEGIDPPEDYVCEGYYTLPNGRRVRCWQEEGHGEQDMAHALANSCNSYFINLGLQLGGNVIKEYAALWGLTEQRIEGYPFYTEQEENIAFNSAVPADVANASIGERGVRLSPLMVAQMIATVANGGQRVYPRLVKDIVNQSGEVMANLPAIQPLRVISEETAAEIRQMLVLAVEEGTALNAAQATVSSGGKTGTAQDAGVWFAGFAPAENPQWAVAVYISNGSAGGREGAAVFAEIISAMDALR